MFQNTAAPLLLLLSAWEAFGKSIVPDATNCLAIREIAIKANQHSNGWIPECESNGTFKVLQHNSTRQFCVTPKGVIFFQPREAAPGTEISCDCPLQFFEILTHPRKFGTFAPSCEQQDGTYSAVQCRPGTPQKRTGSCYCADAKGQYIAEKPREADDSYCLKYRRLEKRACRLAACVNSIESVCYRDHSFAWDLCPAATIIC